MGASASSSHPRLRRIQRIAWVLDRSVPIGGGRRIGLDPILGLLPGGGDALGTALGAYLVFEGARLGVSVPILLRMLGNLALEGVLGTVPLLGDLFDAAWQANMRNVRLIEKHARPDLSGPGTFARLALLALALLLLVVATVALNLWLLAIILSALGLSFSS